ncbi:hypothetical protein J3R83DRAFT_3539 [Lanmaoa asiatica]|nr:hypothetical protein J3R83DRAFT_3539 [Lanmaoa asiatica]
MAQTRFQSIAKAYDLMRGKSAITGEVLTSRERHADPARFRPNAPRRPHFDETTGDERWKERVLFGATVLAIVAFVAQTTVARHKAIVQISANGTRTTSSGPRYSLADEALVEPIESVPSRRP